MYYDISKWGSVSRDTGPCPNIDCACGYNANSCGEPLNFKANSPSPPLGFVLHMINRGQPNSANTSICNNGLPPIGSDQENTSADLKKKKKTFFMKRYLGISNSLVLYGKILTSKKEEQCWLCCKLLHLWLVQQGNYCNEDREPSNHFHLFLQHCPICFRA